VNEQLIKKWEKRILEELSRKSLFASKFIPKYKGKNKLILWLCRKFKIGKTVHPYMVKPMDAGITIKINSITLQSLLDYTRNK
jgi:hypothetical protein